MMIDNLHYADWASLQIFTSLLRELRHNFMLVSTALNSSVDSLSEFILHIPKRVGLKQIHLTRFSIEDMQEIISSKTDINKIPADILTSIYETTAGNAFFLNELLNNYKEQGSLDTFSDQAQNILSQRLQGLSTQSRQLLDIISLLHNYASLNLLEHVNGRSTLDILESVEELTARALIIEKQRHGKTIFTFTHGKMREYVVGLIPPSKCRILYKSIACALEEILPPKNNATYNRLIQYFELAGMQTKVLKYQIYLLEELSIAQYELYPSQVTFEQSPAPADQSAFFSNIEEQLKKERHNFTQDEEYEELSARLLIAKGRYYILSGLYNEGLICIRRCFHLGYVRRHSSYLLRAYRQMIYYGIQLYEPELMKQYLDLGLALASEQNYLMERALFLRLNGLYHLMCNEYEESEEDLRTSISIFEHHTLQNSTTLLNISAAYNYLGELQRKKQQPDKAIAFYHKAIHLCQEHSLAINPTHYTNLGSAYRAVGKNDKAFASYATACSLYDNSYTLMGRSVAKSRYAVFLCERGDFSMSDKFLHEANAACNKLGSPVEKGLLRKTQAELLIQYPKECKEFLPEPLEFYLSDAKRLMNIDHQLPEWKELAEL
ncbi:MAG: hypothetical protein PHC41_04310 [Lachnospiraceae bacterium]|nr:hypothetical protein [Lachnospiraceae bacterium]MDD3615431.1 hypothetical protein [Lachnospiraceae bacterium]